ncbi:hypothetical protein TNCV_1630361 [Trichonephila clavipes]|uniref:Transposase n=1 Tax=Trichonephila clavipes TaxID=2585209 RepID=A0A8X6VWL5_TRICX|nr:hypothetical protein TNCV_1630361 [Trichonephila clavipes]
MTPKNDKNILEPIFEEEIPTSYGKDLGEVELHMDKASSHTSKSTAAYLVDFCAFGLLKRALGKQHPRTLNELWKTIEEEWSKISKKVLRESLLS